MTSFQELIYGLDLLGTFVFTISGVTVALKKDFDLVGTVVMGIVTAIGGGTIRDIMIGKTPVGWLQDQNYLFVIAAAIAAAYIAQRAIMKLHRSFFLFDTIGIGLYTVLGIQKTLGQDLDPSVAVLMGVISACFGGVTRDVLANEIPLIFRKEIYAMACVCGGVTFLALNHFYPKSEAAILFSVLVVMAIRYLSVRKGWTLYVKPF